MIRMIKKEIKELNNSEIGNEVAIMGKVIRKAPLKKPQIVTLSDGTSSIDVVSFSNNLEEIGEGDFIKAVGMVKENKGNIELKEKKIEEIKGDERDKIEKKINKIKKKERRINKGDFLIESEKLEAMREGFEKCASEIKRMIMEGHPVLVRHHADCDGYCAAMSLERAILPLIESKHRSKISALRYYRRAPSRTPFYDYSDAVRDITMINRDKDRVGDKETLLIITDMGSSAQSLLSIKKAKLYGCKIVIIDHHAASEEEDKAIKEIADIHLNPHTYGFDSNLTAGMLGAEVARMINKKVGNIELLPGLSGIADRSECEEMDRYLQLAKADGYDEEYLRKLAMVIDFETYHMRYMESREMTADLLGKNRERQDEMVKIVYPELEKMMEEHTESAIHYMQEIEKNGNKIGIINIKEASSIGYPGAGKIVGSVFSKLSEKGFLSVLGEGDGSVIFRISHNTDVTLSKIMNKLKREFPFAMISGGGHDKAGTIRFLSAEQSKIRDAIIDEFTR